MIVDDHEVVRQGIRTLVTSILDWTVCAEAADGEGALKLAAQSEPDVVIVDISMPGISGLDLIVQLKRLLPRVEILVLTLHDSERLIFRALRAGARGYVLKSDPAGKLIEAITALSRGRPFFSTSISESLLQFYVDGEGDDELTPRERQVLKLVAEGSSNKQVANILKLSVKTVETHRAAMMKKIGAKSTAEIVLYAIRNELVEL
jgi:DNA-binding NarL/FixJ family response regulator